MLKKKITKKRFYGKWLYKVTINLPGVAIMRSKTLDGVIDFLHDDTKTGYNTRSVYHRAKNNAEHIEQVCNFLKELQPESWTKRIETSCIDLYSNDVEIYDNLCQTFDHLIVHHFEPDALLIETSEQQNVIVTAKLPHDKYKYKVFLTPHKLKIKDDKVKFLSWIDLQNDKILISRTVKDWFYKTDWNWDRRYLLVDNEQTLLMLKMLNSNALGKVYEYIISDK